MQNIMECLELRAGVILAWVKFHPVGDTDAMLHCLVYIVTFLQIQCFTVVYSVHCCIATDALLHCTPMQEFMKTDDGVANAMQAVI